MDPFNSKHPPITSVSSCLHHTGAQHLSLWRVVAILLPPAAAWPQPDVNPEADSWSQDSALVQFAIYDG